jgi:hypothetical protein
MFDDMPEGKPFKESDSKKKPVAIPVPVDDTKEKQDFNTGDSDKT